MNYTKPRYSSAPRSQVKVSKIACNPSHHLSVHSLFHPPTTSTICFLLLVQMARTQKIPCRQKSKTKPASKVVPAPAQAVALPTAYTMKAFPFQSFVAPELEVSAQKPVELGSMTYLTSGAVNSETSVQAILHNRPRYAKIGNWTYLLREPTYLQTSIRTTPLAKVRIGSLEYLLRAHKAQETSFRSDIACGLLPSKPAKIHFHLRRWSCPTKTATALKPRERAFVRSRAFHDLPGQVVDAALAQAKYLCKVQSSRVQKSVIRRPDCVRNCRKLTQKTRLLFNRGRELEQHLKYHLDSVLRNAQIINFEPCQQIFAKIWGADKHPDFYRPLTQKREMLKPRWFKNTRMARLSVVREPRDRDVDMTEAGPIKRQKYPAPRPVMPLPSVRVLLASGRCLRPAERIGGRLDAARKIVSSYSLPLRVLKPASYRSKLRSSNVQRSQFKTTLTKRNPAVLLDQVNLIDRSMSPTAHEEAVTLMGRLLAQLATPGFSWNPRRDPPPTRRASPGKWLAPHQESPVVTDETVSIGPTQPPPDPTQATVSVTSSTEDDSGYGTLSGEHTGRNSPSSSQENLGRPDDMEGDSGSVVVLNEPTQTPLDQSWEELSPSDSMDLDSVNSWDWSDLSDPPEIPRPAQPSLVLSHVPDAFDPPPTGRPPRGPKPGNNSPNDKKARGLQAPSGQRDTTRQHNSRNSSSGSGSDSSTGRDRNGGGNPPSHLRACLNNKPKKNGYRDGKMTKSVRIQPEPSHVRSFEPSQAPSRVNRGSMRNSNGRGGGRPKAEG